MKQISGLALWHRTAVSTTMLIAAATVGGCASGGSYPSLAIRDVERASYTVEPAAPDPAPPAPAPPSPGLDGRLAQLADSARAAHSRFLARTARARTLVTQASGAPTGSEGWAVATVALSELEAARGAASIALAELDALHTADQLRGNGLPTTDSPAIAAARDVAAGLVDEETRVIDSLRSRLR
jgi:hypothetical protein